MVGDLRMKSGNNVKCKTNVATRLSRGRWTSSEAIFSTLKLLWKQ